VLLLCAQKDRNPAADEYLNALLEEDLDWDYLLRMVQRHRLRPLLFRHLGTASPETVPESVLDQLRDYFNTNAQRNLFLTAELIRVLREFEAHGVPAIPYKGPALAASVYGNLALREVGDLDILVRKDNIFQARELLASLGYQQWIRLTDTPGSLTSAQEAALMHSRGGHNYVHSDTTSVVDLQWTVAKRHFSFQLSPEYLWQHVQQTRLGGSKILTLSPETLLIVLCMHGSKHLWERLVWVCDVAELVRGSEKLAWENVIEQARISGSERMLLLGLYLTKSLLGSSLPETVLQRVRSDPAVGEIAERVQNRLFSENGFEVSFEKIRFEVDHLNMRERWRDRARYCVLTLMTPDEEDWMSVRLPASLWPFYYVLRPIRLIGKYGQRYLKSVLWGQRDQPD